MRVRVDVYMLKKKGESVKLITEERITILLTSTKRKLDLLPQCIFLSSDFCTANNAIWHVVNKDETVRRCGRCR